MLKSRRTRWIALLALASAGTAFQVGANGCYEYYVNNALVAFDFCSVLNCTGGSFFNFCDPVPLLVDCPNFTTGE